MLEEVTDGLSFSQPEGLIEAKFITVDLGNTLNLPAEASGFPPLWLICSL